MEADGPGHRRRQVEVRGTDRDCIAQKVVDVQRQVVVWLPAQEYPAVSSRRYRRRDRDLRWLGGLSPAAMRRRPRDTADPTRAEDPCNQDRISRVPDGSGTRRGRQRIDVWADGGSANATASALPSNWRAMTWYSRATATGMAAVASG